MLREFFLKGPWARRAWAWFGLLVFVAHQLFKAYLAWAINGWYEVFYNLLQTHLEVASGDEAGSDDVGSDLRGQVTEALWKFAHIVAPAVVVHPIAGLVRNWWCFSWRRTLMTCYIHRWNTMIPPIEGASQRVHEDTQRFVSGIQTCVSVLLESMLTLTIFCPVLYNLDPNLMGIAVAAAAGGLAVSVIVGWPLVGLEVS
jgi:peptide/bleomycin uptake transporter